MKIEKLQKGQIIKNYKELCSLLEIKEELKDITLRFKGSSNQRVIDVQKSLKENKIVLSIYNDKKNSDFHKIY